jgi:hypothetical protein
MSSTWLRIIPRDPMYVPPAAVREQACTVLKGLLPEAEDVQAIVHDGIVFIRSRLQLRGRSVSIMRGRPRHGLVAGGDTRLRKEWLRR